MTNDPRSIGPTNPPWIVWIGLAASACVGDPPRASTEHALVPPAIEAGAQDLRPRLWVAFSAELAPGVRARVEAHLRAASSLPVALGDPTQAGVALPAGSYVVAFGDTDATRAIISASEAASLPPEGFVVQTGTVAGASAIVADGRDARGVGLGAYALLEALGFAFLHPLEPHVPAALAFPARLLRRGAPRWPVRGVHLHTMHPLELTELLNGWGPLGPDDAAGFEAMLPEWERVLEWLVANGQNRVQWVLLGARSWAEFATSETRRQRLERLTARAHAFGLEVGIDVPIALGQQHALRLVEETGALEDELAQIRARLDWLVRAGFDHVATENGTSEFTHGDPARALAWMNEVARHLDEAHGKTASIKVHASTGQVAEGYADPDTGAAINFNFLPHHADRRLGVLPHTVQMYGLDDPAPTYGNRDFADVLRFLAQQAGARPVLWHPESAYWVSYDVDVPLFLPVYAERRLHDLRLIAAREDAGTLGRGAARGASIDGQMLFSSGWEWGYWLNDVIAARAAFELETSGTDSEAFSSALSPVVKIFGPASENVRAILVELAEAERRLLILGDHDGHPPVDVERRNGQAYLQGFDAFDDVADLAARLRLPGIPKLETQPKKLGLVEMRSRLHAPPRAREIAPLLAAMDATFGRLADDLEAERPRVPLRALGLFEELVDAARITALRAAQVHALYDFVGGEAPRLADARAALDAAALVVARREPNYRVPAERIAAWRENPTAYEFTYLWSVRSLYYWWRDEAKAVLVPRSPCFMNIIHPIDVGFGEGRLTDATRIIRDVAGRWPAAGTLAECLAEGPDAPTLPPPDLRP